MGIYSFISRSEGRIKRAQEGVGSRAGSFSSGIPYSCIKSQGMESWREGGSWEGAWGTDEGVCGVDSLPVGPGLYPAGGARRGLVSALGRVVGALSPGFTSAGPTWAPGLLQREEEATPETLVWGRCAEAREENLSSERHLVEAHVYSQAHWNSGN